MPPGFGGRTRPEPSIRPYMLKAMPIIALIFALELTYQDWSYWVFRKRIGRGYT